MKKNKRNIKGVLFLILICSFLVVSCNKNQDVILSTPSYDSKIILGTGGISGTYYPVGAAITVIIKKYVEGVNAVALETNGSVDNVSRMETNEINMLMGAANSLYAAYNGEYPFEKSYKDLRGIAVLFPEAFHVIVLKKSNINSIYDLKNKRIAIGEINSGSRRTALELLKIHGILENDIVAINVSYREGIIKLKQDEVDCAIIVAGIPTIAVIDASAQMDVNLLSVDINLFKDIENFNNLEIYKIPEGTYREVNKEIVTVASPAILAVNKDMDEELVYNILDDIFKHCDEISKAHTQGNNIKMNNIIGRMSIPLHKGAKKFYKNHMIGY